ncbi:hypothetical protein [Paenibacillus arenosi]|uniref:DUF1579 domain-containing protein n=1 Tax=Paenibacillus arenosi TaxID=2774142 RepID=A0ABR9AWY2_9BACL|nr:hypothetical protein [Paenibacillus arenosi]MBD8498603.1 hypothetical protein [Paenibacillus arenosi]
MKMVEGFIRIKLSVLLAMITLLSGMLSSCGLFNEHTADKDEIAVIDVDKSHDHAATFKALWIGKVGTYSLKLHRADRSWVDIWVEGYKKGKKLEQPLLALSYGRYPHETYDGKVGLVWIYGANNKDMIKLYSESSSVGMVAIDQFIGDKSEAGRTGWEYTLGEDGLSLKPGETALIGSFRMNKGSLRTGYDWNDPEAVQEMIQSNDTVMLLKIKVREEKSNTHHR